MNERAMRILYAVLGLILFSWAGLSVWAEKQHAELTECLWNSQKVDDWDACVAERNRFSARVRNFNQALFDP